VIAGVLPVTPPVVAVTTCVVPALLEVAKLTVATPLPFVVVVLEENEPPFVLDHVTTCPVVLSELL
jgi:hypothetical protein